LFIDLNNLLMADEHTRDLAAAPPTGRRSQQQRTARTRALLLDATVECLFQLGYARTTTTEICRRAGVSRGAQLHHFPTKASLVATAVDHLIEQRHEDFRRLVEKVPDHADREQTAIDLLWEMLSGPTFFASLELIVAGRTDPDLAPVVEEMCRRLLAAARDTTAELFPQFTEHPLAPYVPEFLFALLEGAAIQQCSLRDEGHAQRIVDLLKVLIAASRSGGSAMTLPSVD